VVVFVSAALDRSRKIKNFGDAGGHEYCLCERPDACPPTGDAAPGACKSRVVADVSLVTHSLLSAFVSCPVDVVAPVAVAKPSATAVKAPLPNDKAFLKIFMCGFPSVAVV
jgi:hypothetical protein